MSATRVGYLAGGEICSRVHWRGALSGRQRTSLAPWRSRMDALKQRIEGELSMRDDGELPVEHETGLGKTRENGDHLRKITCERLARLGLKVDVVTIPSARIANRLCSTSFASIGSRSNGTDRTDSVLGGFVSSCGRAEAPHAATRCRGGLDSQPERRRP